MPTAPTEQLQAPSGTLPTEDGGAAVAWPSEESLLERAGGVAPPPRPEPRERWLSRAATCLPTLLIAGVLCFVTFVAGGGLNLGDMTTVEIALTLGAGAIAAGGVLLGRARTRAYGAWPLGLLGAFTALTALSVVWSVQPDDSFKDAGRMFAYCAVFGAAIVLARAVRTRWPAVLGGIALAAVVVCGYALLTKVFPDQLDANDIYARLRAPYSYWNAIGLTAAMGAIACMWLGARRAGHALLSALAYPAMGLMLLTLMLAYSRGALVALVLGLALWFCLVPLRLRGAAILISSVVVAGAVVAWDFSQHALDSDNVELAARTSAGHQLGALIVVMVVLLTLVGLAFGFYTGRNAPSLISRRRMGVVLLSLLAIAVLAFAGALAVSDRGFTGSISHAVKTLTDPHAPVPPNTPDRLTAVGSVRARYWNEALKVFQAHPALGRRRGRLCDGSLALPHGDARCQARARLHRADARRPRHRWARAHARPVDRVDGGGGSLHAPVQQALDELGEAARLARAQARQRTPGLGAPDGRRPPRALYGRARRHAQHAVPGRRVRHPFARRLDVVRAGQRLRGAAVRGLAGRSRAAGRVRADRRRARWHDRRPPGRAHSATCGTSRSRRPARAPGAGAARRVAHRRRRRDRDRRAAGCLGTVAAAALCERLAAGADACSRATRAQRSRRHTRASRATRSRRRRCSRCPRCSRRRAARRWRARRCSGRCACSRQTRRRG